MRIRMIFILIILGTIGQNLTVEQESKQYGDIIQIDQVDFYYHNSCKQLSFIHCTILHKHF